MFSKNVLFSNVYAFLSKKSHEIGINKFFFSSEEKYSLKKEKYAWS